jgi:hypothetical protein
MPYQYLPINQAKEGNIVERINTSSSSTKPYEQEGYLAIVGEDFTNYPGNRPALDETYWKLVKTLPGSTAKVGDECIRISGGNSGTKNGDIITVTKCTGRLIYWEPDYSNFTNQFLVLCKAQQEPRVAVVTKFNGGHPIGSRIVKKGNLWTLASDQNGTTWAHTIGSTCEWEDEMPATIKEQPMLAITSFETRMKSKDLWYEFLENIVTDSSITSVAELTKMESHKYPAGAFDWSSSLQGQDFWWHIDQEWVKIRSKETPFFEPHYNPCGEIPIEDLKTASDSVFGTTYSRPQTFGQKVLNQLNQPKETTMVPSEENTTDIEIRINGKVVNTAEEPKASKTDLEASKNTVTFIFDRDQKMVDTKMGMTKKQASDYLQSGLNKIGYTTKTYSFTKGNQQTTAVPVVAS